MFNVFFELSCVKNSWVHSIIFSASIFTIIINTRFSIKDSNISCCWDKLFLNALRVHVHDMINHLHIIRDVFSPRRGVVFLEDCVLRLWGRQPGTESRRKPSTSHEAAWSEQFCLNHLEDKNLHIIYWPLGPPLNLIICIWKWGCMCRGGAGGRSLIWKSSKYCQWKD